ncbi:hypothetical protein M422DRAFT_66396 [Sphaerobolus stellatus SS14]|uniref:Uncharacterized protein n=1 Tax=Sphaerobolus stellatus (strain SS14) TaxID=990650 RepID=A0A0C9W626_SPHS4|nr:hypothetical protein M422DRAFT_66396 [Sphaerobolus stellatus SS14]
MADTKGVMFPDDIWKYLASHFLDHTELTNLSSTCRYTRSSLASVLFRAVVFEGTNYQKRLTYQLYFAHLLYTQRRMQFALENPDISASLQFVELRNWTGFHRRIWIDADDAIVDWDLAAIDNYKHRQRVEKMREELLSLFQENYRKVVALINKLPKLRQVTIWEDSPIIWDDALPPQLDSPHCPRMGKSGKFTYIEFDVTEHSSSEERFNIVPSGEWYVPPQANYTDFHAAWTRYLTTFVKNTTIPIQAAYVDADLLLTLSPELLERFHTVTKFFGATSRDPNPIASSKPIVEGILENAHRLTSYSPCDYSPMMPATGFPHLKCYSGPSSFLPNLFDHSPLSVISPYDASWEDFLAIAHTLPLNKRSQVHGLDVGWLVGTKPKHLIEAAELFPCLRDVTVSWVWEHSHKLVDLWNAIKDFRYLEVVWIQRVGIKEDYFENDIENDPPTYPSWQVIEYDNYTVTRKRCCNEWKDDVYVTGSLNGCTCYTEDDMAEAQKMVEKFWPGYEEFKFRAGVSGKKRPKVRNPLIAMKKYMGASRGLFKRLMSSR